MVGDITMGVPEHFHNRKANLHFIDNHLISPVNGMSDVAGTFIGGAINGYCKMFMLVPDAANMVGVMVGDQDRDSS